MLEKNTFKLRTLTWPVWYFLIRTSCFLLPIANLAVTSNWSHDLFVTFSAILYMSETKNLNRISLKSFWFNQCLSLVIVLQKIDPNLNSTNQHLNFQSIFLRTISRSPKENDILTQKFFIKDNLACNKISWKKKKIMNVTQLNFPKFGLLPIWQKMLRRYLFWPRIMGH